MKNFSLGGNSYVYEEFYLLKQCQRLQGIKRMEIWWTRASQRSMLQAHTLLFFSVHFFLVKSLYTSFYVTIYITSGFSFSVSSKNSVSDADRNSVIPRNPSLLSTKYFAIIKTPAAHLCINQVPKEANEHVVLCLKTIHYIQIKLWRRVPAACNCSIKLNSFR